MISKDFERAVEADIHFLTEGLNLFDPTAAITCYVSERTRCLAMLNDDLTIQQIFSDRIRQLFITDLTADCEDREVVPQIVIARDISKDLSRELGWRIAVVRDYPLGSMAPEEQQAYFARLPGILCAVEPVDLNERIVILLDEIDERSE